MTNKYEAPFEGGKTPKKNPGVVAGTSRPVGSSRAAHLARLALKKAASKPVKESAPERPWRKVYEPTSAQELNPGLRARIDAASNAQKPAPAGSRPIGKIKLMTRKEEVEQMPKRINGREYAKHGVMHPMHAGEPIHRVADHYVDFYASGTGDKMQGKVKLNDGKSVHIQAHPRMGDGKLHKFEVSADLPDLPKKKKMTNEAKDNREYDYEGDMAMSQLKSVITNAQKLHDMLDPDTNLPEWVQSKITLAEDYIVTAANYMDGEINEDAQQDYAHTSAVAADRKRRAASDFADKGFENPVLSPAQRERRQELSRAATSASDMESAKFLNPKRPVGSHPDRVIRGLNKDTEQARIGMRALTAKVRAEKKPNLPEEVDQIDEISKKILVSPPGDDGKGGYGSKALRAHLAAKASGNTEIADRRARGYNLAQAKAYPGQYANSPNKAKVPATNEEAEQVEEGLVGSLVKAYVSPKAQALVSKGVGAVAGRLGASSQTKRRLQKAGMKWAKSKIGEDVEQVEENARGYEKLASAIKDRVARKKLAVEAHDAVGEEDADINNDGKTDKTDVYLHTKRRAIGKAIGTRLATKAGK